MPYTLGVYMVRDFLGGEGVADEAAVGRLAGWLGGMLCMAQLATSYSLGRLSDRIGRRPVLILGNCSCVVSVIAFGCSQRLWQAALARFAGGAFNACIGAEKAMIGELLDIKEQATAMAWMSLAWGVGTLIGPMLGILAKPCASVLTGSALCAEGGLFTWSPFLLPCLAASAFSAVAAVWCALSLEESAPWARSKLQYQPVRQNEVELEMAVGAKPALRSAGTRQAVDADSPKAVPVFEEDLSAASKQQSQPWHKQRNVRLSLAGYGLTAFVFIVLDELTPLFVSAPVSSGGLGLPTAQLAAPLSFGGLALLLWAWRGFPWVHSHLGTVKTCVFPGLLCSVPVALLIPLASVPMLPPQPVMWLAMACKSIVGVNAFTACLIMVNTVSPREHLGAVNGLGQSIASGARALGPVLGGMAWAASLQIWPGWGHQFLPFAGAACIAVATAQIFRRLTLPEPLVGTE